MHLHASLLAAFSTFIAVAVSQKCYGLDGTALDNTFTPCNPSAKHSGCCATNRSVGADICLDSGLCLATKGEYMGSIWQNGCTDATGKDIACPKMCPDASTDFGGLNPVPAWNVQMCDYGTYCCRAVNDRKNCCNDATAPRISTKNIGKLQLATLTASSSTTAISTTTSTPPTTAVSTPTSTPLAITSPSELTIDSTTPSTNDLCKKEKHQTAVVGGAVGGILGIVLIGLSFTMLWMYKKEQRQRKLKEHYEEQFSRTSAYRKMLASSSRSLASSELDNHFGDKIEA